VQRLEARYGVTLPDDFRDYLLKASGNGSEWTSRNGIGWYSIDRIRNLREALGGEAPEEGILEIGREADRYLVFADFLDWCGYGYAICCSDGQHRGQVAMVCPIPHRFISRDFPTFAKLAAEDSDRLHSPVGDRYSDIA
jgi:hypothetical protein